MNKINIHSIPERNKLTHNNMIFDPDYKYEDVVEFDMKPKGFWYGLKYHWLIFGIVQTDYDALNNLVDIGIKHLFSVNINDELFTALNEKNSDKILVLATYKDILYFSNKYGKSICDGIINSRAHLFCNWDAVMKDYGGIEIRYNPKKLFTDCTSTLKHMWLHCWDVPSGVIWNKKILEKIIVTEYISPPI